MLENTFLETLIITSRCRGITFEEVLAVISALQRNTTLKTIDIGYQTPFLTDDEVKQLVSIVMKNYGLERLVPDISCTDDGTVKAI
jgi:hypothetical protein